MTDFNFLSDLLIILITAFIFGFLAKRFKQPPITGYVLGGAVVSLLGARITTHAISTLTDFGVILLMFALGIEFSFRRLLRVKEIAIFGAGLQILIFSLILSFILISFLKINPYQSFYISLALSLSSTAIAVKMLFDKGEVETLYGEILTGWLLIQDLALIPIWVIMPAVWQSLNTGSFSLVGMSASILLSLLKAGVILYVVYWLGKRLVPMYLNKVAKTNTRELFLIAVVLLISFLGILVSKAGLSPALGAFLAGLLVAETSQNHEIFAEIRPLRDILSIVFFVSLGILSNFTFLFANFGIVLFLTLIVMILKFVVVDVIMVLFGYHSKTTFLTSIGLISVGEFAFVLGRYGIERGFITTGNYNILMSVTIITMVFVPLAISASNSFYHTMKGFFRSYAPLIYERIFTKLDRNNPGDGEELPLRNHVVICGHGRVGRHISRILEMVNVPYVVLDFNQKVVNDLKKHAANVIYGDPSDIEILDYAQVDYAKAIIIAVPDRHSQEMIIQNSLFLNKNIIIICRSHYEEDKDRLYALGAHAIIQPEFEAALHMSGVLLNLYKFPQQEIVGYLNRIRKET